MRYRTRFLITLICSTMCLVISAGIANNSLLHNAEQLYCASDPDTAKALIKEIRQVELFTPGLPNESDDPHNPNLQAVTLDRLLSALYHSSVTHPTSRDLVEATVTDWNYCSVIDNGSLYDHKTSSGKITRTRASDPVNQWQGFKAFGLIDHEGESFRFSTAFKTSVHSLLAEKNHRDKYINQCLPHPDDGHLYRSFGRNIITRLFNRGAVNEGKDIPWPPECAAPPKEEDGNVEQPKLIPELADNTKNQPLPVSDSLGTDSDVHTTTDSSDQKDQPLQAETTPEPATMQPELASAKPAIPSIQSPAINSPSETTLLANEPVAVNKIAVDTSSTAEGVHIDIEQELGQVSDIQPKKTPKKTPEEVTTPVVSLNPSINVPITVPGILKGFSGSVSLENSSLSQENLSLRLAASYKPFSESYWFIRSSMTVSPDESDPGFSWGVGYDDWHAGTWGVQLNHWGPLRKGDGLDLKNAVADVSYKIKSHWLTPHKLSSSVSLSKPLSGDPSLNWGFAWNPHSHWFVRSTLSKTVDLSGINWSYGFGYARYSANTLSFEYNNWGPNQLPTSNFRQNGLLSFTYRWAF